MRKYNFKQEKIEFSKIIVLITSILFITCLFFGFTIQRDVDITDTAILCTAITVSGGIFATSVLYYLKKAQAENTMKLKSAMYQIVINEKLRYNEEAIKLKQKYDEDIINDEDVDNFVSASLEDLSTSVNDAVTDATSLLETQTF